MMNREAGDQVRERLCETNPVLDGQHMFASYLAARKFVSIAKMDVKFLLVPSN